MKKHIIFLVVFSILGLVVGYLFFGKIASEYVSISTIFSSSGGSLESIGRKITGIAAMRQNILISGGVGAIVGIMYSFLRKKK